MCPLDIYGKKWIIVDEADKILQINLINMPIAKKSILHYCTVRKIYSPNFDTQKVKKNFFIITKIASNKKLKNFFMVY